MDYFQKIQANEDKESIIRNLIFLIEEKYLNLWALAWKNL